MTGKNEHVEFVERNRADIIDMVNLKMDQMKEKFTATGVQERNAAAPPQKKEESQSGSGKYKRQMKGEGFWNMLGYEPTEKIKKEDKNTREGGLIDLGYNTQNASENSMQGKGKGKGKGRKYPAKK